MCAQVQACMWEKERDRTTFLMAWNMECLHSLSPYIAILSGDSMSCESPMLKPHCVTPVLGTWVLRLYKMLVSVWTACKWTSSSLETDIPFPGTNQTHCFQWSHQCPAPDEASNQLYKLQEQETKRFFWGIDLVIESPRCICENLKGEPERRLRHWNNAIQRNLYDKFLFIHISFLTVFQQKS